VLADGLTYARQLGATHLIDAATLTGAIGVALGKVFAGAFSNDDETYGKFEAALEVSGEKFWRLPLGDEYAELIKSDIGDIKNTGGRWGGASTAAEFLKVFAEETPWIHLDIAGMAWVDDARPYIAKGPSGVAVRSILEWVGVNAPDLEEGWEHSEEARMMDRTELLESALDALPDGHCVVRHGRRGCVLEPGGGAITGYAGLELLGHRIPERLEPLAAGAVAARGTAQGRGAANEPRRTGKDAAQARPRVADDSAHSGVARRGGRTNRNGCGLSSGGEPGCAAAWRQRAKTGSVEASQADLEERLQIEFEDFCAGALPFGVLVDLRGPGA
jgi:PAS domain-containing protein